MPAKKKPAKKSAPVRKPAKAATKKPAAGSAAAWNRTVDQWLRAHGGDGSELNTAAEKAWASFMKAEGERFEALTPALQTAVKKRFKAGLLKACPTR